MVLKVLGSSSKGNCYILENDSEALILEAGVRFSDVQKALNFNISKVKGCLISHEHKDHIGFVTTFPRFIKCYCSRGTAQDIEPDRVSTISPDRLFSVGGFKVIPFSTVHDAAEPLGFFINHEETGNILFATDTSYLPCTFSDLSNILIECNYRIDILESNIERGFLPPSLRNRIVQSHFSYEYCKEALLANDLSKVNNIVLIHLSEGNSNSTEFREGITRATGKTVVVAEAGMDIPFNRTPF